MKNIVSKYLTLTLGLCLVDLLLKYWASHALPTYLNEGFMFGSFAKAPAAIRVIALASFSGFLLFFYVVALVLTSKKIPSLKWGGSLIMSGVLGNSIDRAFKGSTTDFIPMTFFGHSTYYNLADVFLVLGAIGVCYGLFKHEDTIWHPENVRQGYLVNPKEQLRFAFKLVFIGLSSSLILGLFSFSYWNLTLQNDLNNFHLLKIYLFVYVSLALTFSIIVFFIGIVISHKTAGPLYAFEIYVEKILEGERESLKLRDGDNYKHLEIVAEKLLQRFKNNDKKID